MVKADTIILRCYKIVKMEEPNFFANEAAKYKKKRNWQTTQEEEKEKARYKDEETNHLKKADVS